MMMATAGEECILKNSGLFKKITRQRDVYNRCVGFTTQVRRRPSTLFELSAISQSDPSSFVYVITYRRQVYNYMISVVLRGAAGGDGNRDPARTPKRLAISVAKSDLGLHAKHSARSRPFPADDYLGIGPSHRDVGQSGQTPMFESECVNNSRPRVVVNRNPAP